MTRGSNARFLGRSHPQPPWRTENRPSPRNKRQLGSFTLPCLRSSPISVDPCSSSRNDGAMIPYARQRTSQFVACGLVVLGLRPRLLYHARPLVILAHLRKLCPPPRPYRSKRLSKLQWHHYAIGTVKARRHAPLYNGPEQWPSADLTASFASRLRSLLLPLRTSHNMPA